MQIRALRIEQIKLNAETKTFRVEKQEIIGLLMRRMRTKGFAKATRKLIENIEEAYVGIVIHSESECSR